MSLYSQLYPNLNFSRKQTKGVPTLNISKVAERRERSSSNKRDEKPQEAPKILKTEEPIEKREPDPPKTVKIESPKRAKSPTPEKPVEKPQTPVKEDKESKPPKVRSKRPNREKKAPKPEPVRETVLPKAGEQGLQRRYTAEQRKQMYLDRLSRMSVRKAEAEVAKVNEMLDQFEGDTDKLKEAERQLKGKIKLINRAKFFATNNIHDDITTKNDSLPQNEPSQTKDGSRADQDPTGRRRRRRRREDYVSSTDSSSYASTSDED